MSAPEHSRGSPARKRAVLLALGYYGRQMARLRRFTVPAMLLPALGNTCIFYIAPLIVAHLVGRLAGPGLAGIGAAIPYVLGFAGVRLFAEYRAALENVERFPQLYPLVEDGLPGREFRNAVLTRLNYRIVYEVRVSEVLVVAVLYTGRQSDLWHARITDA